ncbi:recombinase family protein [Leucobacter salsicius]|uniref:recombinase family protein n=1 Tax=Leucobacter salsicius TaxID=664638 RepID=UPI00034C999C|nr:recombinase family protein [Leucobacter salsicius]
MRALRPVPAIAPRAVLYLRQSVARDDSISLELQEIAGRDYCVTQGYEVVSVEVDEGLSGRNWSKRPAVQRAMASIEARDADIIVLWKWSRLSRNRKDWALAADRVDVAGGRIESATEPIDTATASGRFARGVMTEYAAFQSEQIGEQWAEVRARRFNLGLPPTGSVPWGWTSHKTYITADPDKAPYLREMYRMYLSGSGYTAIASWLNRTPAKTTNGRDWLHATIRRLLDSPIHAGKVEYLGQIRDGAHDGIITDTEWQQYQALRKDRHIAVRPRTSPYLLASIIVCHCGRKRHGKREVIKTAAGDVERRYYQCPSTTGHPRKSIAAHHVDQAITNWVKQLPHITVDAGDTTGHSIDIEALAREITGIEKQLVKLTEHLLSGLVPEPTYRDTKELLTGKATGLRLELEAAKSRQSFSPAMFLSGSEDLVESWDILETPDRQSLLRTLVRSVTVREDRKLDVITAWGTTEVIDTL